MPNLYGCLHHNLTNTASPVQMAPCRKVTPVYSGGLFDSPESSDEDFDLPPHIVQECMAADCSHFGETLDYSNFFQECDLPESVFLFSPTYFGALENITTVAGKVATAVLKSDKFLTIIINLARGVHLKPHESVDMALTMERMRKLIDKKFLVTAEYFASPKRRLCKCIYFTWWRQ